MSIVLDILFRTISSPRNGVRVSISNTHFKDIRRARVSVILDIEEGGWVGTFDMTGSKSKIADPDFALTWIQRVVAEWESHSFARVRR